MTKTDTIAAGVGTKVYCTVHGCEGWTTIWDVRPRDGYIKISGERVWCPPHNFSLTRGDEHQAGCSVKTFGLGCSLGADHRGPCSPIDTRPGKRRIMEWFRTFTVGRRVWLKCSTTWVEGTVEGVAYSTIDVRLVTGAHVAVHASVASRDLRVSCPKS